MVTRRQPASDLIASIIGYAVAAFAIDAFGAWVLMSGLHGLHVRAAFWPCFMILVAVSIAAKSGSGKA